MVAGLSSSSVMGEGTLVLLIFSVISHSSLINNDQREEFLFSTS